MALSSNRETKQQLIKKHVNAIHCSNKLTLVQRKVFNAFLLNAYHDLPTKSQYEIPTKKLCELIGYDSRDYKKLKKSITELISTVIEWSVIDQSKQLIDEKWRASSIISAAKIENGICTYEFSSIMRELLYHPEMYGKIDIEVMIEFKSGYGLALYENCIRFQAISQTPWLSTNTFRKLMGVSENNYQNFCDLKKRVLDIAVKEVNKYSPINVIPEITRVNKKVTSIRFKLSNKHNTVIDDEEIKPTNPILINTLKTDFSLSVEIVTELLSRYDIEYITQKVELIKKSDSFKSGKIRELAAYLMDALKRDYKKSKSSKTLAYDIRNVEEERNKIAKKIEDENQRNENENKRKLVDDYLNGIDQNEKNALMLKFEKYLQEKDGFYLYKKYKKTGIHDIPVRAVFNSFIVLLLQKEAK